MRITHILPILIFFVALPSVATPSFYSEIGLNTFYESNVFYREADPKGDLLIKISPNVDWATGTKKTEFRAEADLSYTKFLKYGIQDYFDANGRFELDLNRYGSNEWQIFALTNRISEPANQELGSRLDYLELGGGAKTKIDISKLSRLEFEGSYILQTGFDNTHLYLGNAQIMGGGIYRYQFLPETSVFAGIEGGVIQYPNGLVNANDPTIDERIKYGSTRAYLKFGMQGRLAENTRIDGEFGFLIHTFQASSGFSEPIFNVEIEEQFGPRDILTAGYDYEVKDSKFTNYVLNQRTHLGYGRILGDQILFLTRLSYTYSTYSKPFRREDQRLAARFQVEYSLENNWRLRSELEIDILNSDAYNINNLATDLDPVVSYDQFRFGVTLTYLL